MNRRADEIGRVSCSSTIVKPHYSCSFTPETWGGVEVLQDIRAHTSRRKSLAPKRPLHLSTSLDYRPFKEVKDDSNVWQQLFSICYSICDKY
jgi:hypothetical protein